MRKLCTSCCRLNRLLRLTRCISYFASTTFNHINVNYQNKNNCSYFSSSFSSSSSSCNYNFNSSLTHRNSNVSSRKFHTSHLHLGNDLKSIYKQRKEQLKEYDFPADVNRKAIFANNEVQLEKIEVYGFDYDYTLASYTPELHDLIYDLGRDSLVYNSKYPDGLRKMKYDPNFAVRGLHYDVRKGLLMKIDSFHHIMLGTVYRGLQPVPDDEVKELYDGTHVPLESMNTFYGTGLMYQLMDLFALPEITLLANVTEYFIKNSIPFDPEYVFHDVRTAVQDIHLSGLLHQEIMSNLGKYLQKGPEVLLLLQRLTEAKKKLFLITNSGFPFVDAGMRYIVGPDWQSLFDVVITNARKPKFFNEATRPFRIYDAKTGTQSWDRVHKLERGKIYQQGNFSLLRQMTGWFGSKVFYFGDHVYSDLADVALRHGWRTGAIIPELENEIDKINAVEYKSAVRWGMVLQQMVEYCQDRAASNEKEILKEWLMERDNVRTYAKQMFNPHFGSVFRTHHNPTYFSRRLSRFADLYMSNLTNLLRYSIDHTFYPRRLALPHESQPFANSYLLRENLPSIPVMDTKMERAENVVMAVVVFDSFILVLLLLLIIKNGIVATNVTKPNQKFYCCLLCELPDNHAIVFCPP